jgi:hypothetical protein
VIPQGSERKNGRSAVRALEESDLEAYARFRARMWPTHPGAGAWEAVRFKYVLNPLAALCPGSALYAYERDEEIIGIIGAYPAPVTLNGQLHPGHMLVDWAVLPTHQYGPAAAQLWDTAVNLPGRKYSSPGSRASQRILERRAVRIPSSETIVILRPFDVALLRVLRLTRYAFPSPVLLDKVKLPDGVRFGLTENLTAPVPFRPSHTAFVRRDREYWQTFCEARIFNGAVPLHLATGEGEANVVMRLFEVGEFRRAILMALSLSPATMRHARKAAKLLRRTLRQLKVSFVEVVEADELLQQVARSLGALILKAEAWWYGIPRPSDTFAIEDVRWWFTSADRDAAWQLEQPSAMT